MKYSLLGQSFARRITAIAIFGTVFSFVVTEAANATPPINVTAANACTTMSRFAYSACRFDVMDDYREGIANCVNIARRATSRKCQRVVNRERRDGQEECNDIRGARIELCDRLGEAPYDVTRTWKQRNFENPSAIGNGVAPNPYFNLTPGTRRVMSTGDESTTVEVLDKIKLIGGVRCVVVNDIEVEDGKVVEDTDDWYAQDKNGDVWYCGEISENFESFEGDDPDEPELVDIDGSWKAFRDYAMPGIKIKAAPSVGDIYRQEFALGEAEDIAEVISTTANGLLRGDRCEDRNIAAGVAAACNNDCMVTRETTPLEPDVLEHKYYQLGVGLILEINKVEGDCALFE